MIKHSFTTAGTTLLILAVTLISLARNSGAFSTTRSPIHHNDRHLHRPPTRARNSPVALFAGVDDKGIDIEENTDNTESKKEEGGKMKALAPSSSSNNDNADEQDDVPSGEVNAAPTQFMVTREMKRAMVEELGYKRAEVDSIRIELVANIIENRIRCPSEGMPTDWIDRELEALNQSIRENDSSMMERLENESKYPLKFPLLAVSLVLFGKGFSDALITLIKVNMAFPGASLTAQFQGIPVLAIDVVCVIAGVALGSWTWKTMK